MDLPETRQQKILLFDFYEALLTHKQCEIFKMHYMEDNSLSEVGDRAGITPQGVSDMLKRVNKRLDYYERILGMASKHNQQQAIAARINIALNDLEKNPDTPERGAIISQIRRHLNNLASNF
jgi:predicted DNA-binding protein YlxM (UPF0122 family)